MAIGSRIPVFLVALALAACGDGGGGSSTVVVGAPTPTPPTTAPATPAPSYVGAVYAGTNGIAAEGNMVFGFGRTAEGVLVPLDSYETGGKGGGEVGTMPQQPNLNALVAEDSIIAVDNRFLIVVNAGSNNVTSFRINPNFSLTRIDIEPSGGILPVSLAYRNGVIYVANADEGPYEDPDLFDQHGKVTAMRIDLASGQLTLIPGFSLSLGGRPSDLEVTPDGAYLVASVLNAGSPNWLPPTAAEVSSFRIQSDGSLAATPVGIGMSTARGNAAGRNLPNAIGIETYSAGGRQFLIAAEARMASSTGVPPLSFETMQTGSVSTWEIGSDGALLPRTQDFQLGATATSGPLQAGFLAYSSLYSTFWVATTAGATISGFGLRADGTIGPGEMQVAGIAVTPVSQRPLSGADGYVDMAISPDGRWLYQLVGLKGRIDVYEIDTLVAFNISRRQQVTGLLPMDNLQGLVAVGPAA